MIDSDVAVVRTALTHAVNSLESAHRWAMSRLRAEGMTTAEAEGALARWWRDDVPVDVRSLAVRIGSPVSNEVLDR
jgi:hypothetical protein